MFELLDADDLFAELLMQRSNDSRGFIVVEGQSDCAVLDRFIDELNFTTIPANSKDRALGAIKRAHETGRLTAVFAALDRDWVGLLEEGLQTPDVAYTDYYDLDAVIFFSSTVYEDLAAAFCTDQSFKRGNPGCSHSEIIGICRDLALPIGILRFISRRNGLELKLRDFPLSEVARIPEGKIDLFKLVRIACHRAKKSLGDCQHLVPMLEAEIAAVTDTDRYCSGHDLSKAFSLIAKRRWASSAGADMIERAARAAFPRQSFEKSNFFLDSSTWRNDSGKSPWLPSEEHTSTGC